MGEFDLVRWVMWLNEKYGFVEGSDSVEGSVSVEQERNADDLQGPRRTAGGFEVSSERVTVSGALDEDEGEGYRNTVGSVEFENNDSGTRGDVTLVRAERDFVEEHDLDEHVVARADISLGSARNEATLTEDGLSVGVQANAVEGSVTIGTTGTGDSDEEQRFGVGVGTGGDVRIHGKDSDGDGIPEIGFGVDAGPVSYDVKTEDPLRTALESGMGHVSLDTAAEALHGTIKAKAEDPLRSALEASMGHVSLDEAGEALHGAITDLVSGDEEDD